MSRRTLAHDSGPKNPAVNYLEFKSDGHKKPVFAYFDKEKYEGYTEDEIKKFRKQYDDSEIDELPWNVRQELPMKVMFLENFSTIRGWSDSNSSSIYANDITYLNSQPITVKLAKGGKVIASGLYNDIKADVNAMGGKFTKSVYCISEEGKIICVLFKGAALASYSEFMDKVSSDALENRWLVVNSFEKKKKGSIKYTVPTFQLGDTLSSDEFKQADEAYKQVAEWYKGQESKIDQLEQPAPEPEPVVADDDYDDMPF